MEGKKRFVDGIYIGNFSPPHFIQYIYIYFPYQKKKNKKNIYKNYIHSINSRESLH